MKLFAIALVSLLAASGAAAAAVAVPSADGPQETVDCLVSQVKQVLSGVTPLPCDVGARAAAADAGLEEFVHCTVTNAKNALEGIAPMPCVLEPGASEVSTAGPDPQQTIDCAKYVVGGIVGGHPQPCRPF